MYHRIISRKVFPEHDSHIEQERRLMQNYCCCTSIVLVNGNLPVDKGNVLTHSLALHCLNSWISAVQSKLPRSAAKLSGFDFYMDLYFGLQQESLSFY